MSAPFLTEPTGAGEQSLVPGVRPIGMRERLEQRMDAPLGPLRPQKPMDIGLFDEIARRQLDLFAPAPTKLPQESG